MDREMNRFVLLIAVIAGFGGFLFGFDSSVIADIRHQVTQQLMLSSWQWSQVVSFSLLGSILGIPCSGLLADHVSRRLLLKLVALGFIVGTALCAQANSLTMLLAGRFLIGVCIGVASYVTPLFIAEIAPPAKRGSLILINGLTITLGQVVAYFVGYLLHDVSASSWRLILWLGVIPAIVLFIGMFLVPHTPRWLMKQKGWNETRQALTKIRVNEADIEKELAEIALSASQLSAPLKTLFTPPVLFVLLVGIGLGLFQQFSGINAIMYYGPIIFESAGFYPVKMAILATFCISMINFVFTAVTLFYIDRFGRRFLLLSGTLIATLSLFAVSLLFQLHLPMQKTWILLTLSLYVMGYCISVGSLFWVVISEIYPLHVRGLAMSIATVLQWGANFLVSISFLEVYQHLGESLTFALFSLFCLCAFLFIYYFVPETTGVSLEEIEANLMAGKRIREIGQMPPAKKFELIME